MGDGAMAEALYTHFHTDKVACEEGFTFWRDGLAPIVKVCNVDSSALDQFSVSVNCFNLQGLLFSRETYAPQEMRLGREVQGGEGADALLVRLFVDGSCEYYDGRLNAVASPGDIVLSDLADPLIMRSGQSQMLSLLIPRDMIRGYAEKSRLGSSVRLSSNTAAGKILGHFLQILWQRLSSASVMSADTVAQMLLGCTAGVFGQGDINETRVDPALRYADLEYIRAYIDRHLTEPSLNVERLCRRFGYSRTSLYQLFQPLGGVASYIRKARLECCFQELGRLGGTSVRINEVSTRWGFSDYNQFCRLFRNVYGMTPRQAIAGGCTAYRTARLERLQNEGHTEDIFAWIHGLPKLNNVTERAQVAQKTH